MDCRESAQAISCLGTSGNLGEKIISVEFLNFSAIMLDCLARAGVQRASMDLI